MSKTGRSLEDGAEEPPAKRIKVEEILVARSLPTTKRKGGRQPQKTGEERAKELLKDTRLAAVEPQQVLCRMCGNWIRLFKHVDYAPANWRSHALKCEIRSKWISQVKKEPNDEFELSLPIPEPPHQSPSSEIHPVTVKEENPNSRRQMKSLQERRSTLADDKRAAYPEPHRVFCKLCSSWVRLHNTREYDLFNWSRHVEKCELKAPGTKRVRLKKSHKENNQRPSLTLTFRAGRTQNPVQTVDVPSDPIPSPIIPKNEPIEPPMPSTSTVVPSVPSAGLLKRKPRNILERLKDLEMDPRCGDVRESEVFCLMCQKWVKLSRDVPYIDANWIRHASRCSEKNWLNPLVRALSPFDIKPDIDKLDSDALEVEELCFRPVNSTPDLELRQSSKPTDRPALPTTNDGEIVEAVPFEVPRKRTQEERKQAMLDDPRCSDVQPFNVTCNMCSRQIGLHGKKAYFISNWLRHAESCEAKSKRAEGPIEKPAPSVLQLASVSKRPDPPNAKPAGPVLQLAPDFIPSPAVSWNILKEHENEHSVKHRRSRDQRAQELLNDDRIGEVEPHRVLCKICKEWVGLHNSKEYFSYTWYKHVDRCEQKRKGITPKRRTADTPVDEVHHVPKIPFSRKTLEERKTQLESDPRVGDVEPHRIHCKVCDKWLKLNNDIEYATFNWFKHISKCDGKTASPVKGDVGPSEKPAEVAEVVEVPPPPKTKTRTTAQEREVKLRQDPRLVEVEAHRCLCGMCGRWLKLQNKIEYDAHNWLSHAIKCEVKTGWKPGSTLNATSIADPDPEGLNAVKVEPSTSTPELLAKKPCPPVPRPRGRPPSFKVKPEPTTTSIGTPLDKFVRKSDAQREAELRADPRQKGVERGRVLCGSCDNWIKLNYQHSFLPGNWLRHAERCHGAGRADVVKKEDVPAAIPSGPKSVKLKLKADVVDVDEDEDMEGFDSSVFGCVELGHLVLAYDTAISALGISVPPLPEDNTSLLSPSTTSLPPRTPISSKTLVNAISSATPGGRRVHRTHEGRKKELEADPRARIVQPTQVQCDICGRWIQLRRDVAYSGQNWYKHAGICAGRTGWKAPDGLKYEPVDDAPLDITPSLPKSTGYISPPPILGEALSRIDSTETTPEKDDETPMPYSARKARECASHLQEDKFLGAPLFTPVIWDAAGDLTDAESIWESGSVVSIADF